MVTTIVQALEEAAFIDNRGLSFLDYNFVRRQLSWSQVVYESKRRGQLLLSEGLKKGDRLGMIVPDEKQFVLFFFGAILVGIVPVPVFSISRGGRDGDSYRYSKIFQSCEAQFVLISESLRSTISPLSSEVPSIERILTVETLVNHNNDRILYRQFSSADIKPSDTCFLQFTSGSTFDPKGVIITHENLIANLRGITGALKLEAEKEIFVSWLPYFHDMGLVGFVLLPTVLNCEAVFMSPVAFVSRPQTWLEAISRYRGTITGSPNFGLGLATKSAARMSNADLSCLHSIVCGAEPIQPDTLRSFIDTFKPFGLASSAVVPAYGMAEATLCISLRKSNELFQSVQIDQQEYEALRVVETSVQTDGTTSREIVSCGRVIPDHEFGIMDEKSILLEEGRVGEVVFKGKSVSSGYYCNKGSHYDSIHGEWLRTGDLGFILNQELYISGRIKDLIIIAGRNLHPQLIEWCVESIPGIRRGNVVAFSLSGSDTERLIIVAEKKDDIVDIAELKNAVIRIVNREMGVEPYEVIIVAAKTIAKTSSGKLQRRKVKAAYEAGFYHHQYGTRVDNFLS